MKGELDLPQGYVASRRDRAKLVADVELEHELRRAGLDQPAGWETRLGQPAAGPGRGATSLLELSCGRVRCTDRRSVVGEPAIETADHIGSHL